MSQPTPKSNTLVIRLLGLAIVCYFLWEKIVSLSTDKRVAQETIISHFAFKLLIWFFGLLGLALISFIGTRLPELILWVKAMFKGWKIKANLKGLGQEISAANDTVTDSGTDSDDS